MNDLFQPSDEVLPGELLPNKALPSEALPRETQRKSLQQLDFYLIAELISIDF